jgi:hypothetical protein
VRRTPRSKTAPKAAPTSAAKAPAKRTRGGTR